MKIIKWETVGQKLVKFKIPKIIFCKFRIKQHRILWYMPQNTVFC